jgi:enoyl-CoA hydratase
MLDAAHAERIGLVDQVLPRPTFEKDWRRVARALWRRAGARLWVRDARWGSADRVMNGSAEVGGAT